MSDAYDILCIGGGGHARVLLSIIKKTMPEKSIAVLDSNPDKAGEKIHGFPVIGDDSMLEECRKNGTEQFIIGLGMTDLPASRAPLFEKILKKGLKAVSIIDPSAVLADDAVIGAGTVAMPGVIVNTGAVIGENVIVNSGAVVEHDTVVGDHTHVAPGAVVCGDVKIGEGCLIGAGSVIRQGLKIGAHSVIGAGTVVIEDIPSGARAYGNPARQVSE